MAGRAAPRTVKELPTRLDVPCLQIGGVHALASAFFRKRIVPLRVDESHQGGDLFIRVLKPGHPLLNASVAQNGSDRVSARILGHKFRTREIRPALSAPRIGPVTKCTGLPEEQSSGSNRRW